MCVRVCDMKMEQFHYHDMRLVIFIYIYIYTIHFGMTGGLSGEFGYTEYTNFQHAYTCRNRLKYTVLGYFYSETIHIFMSEDQ